MVVLISDKTPSTRFWLSIKLWVGVPLAGMGLGVRSKLFWKLPATRKLVPVRATPTAAVAPAPPSWAAPRNLPAELYEAAKISDAPSLVRVALADAGLRSMPPSVMPQIRI